MIYVAIVVAAGKRPAAVLLLVCRKTSMHVWQKVEGRTRPYYVGTMYGGSIFGAVDPIYIVMLLKILGPGYVVWDKAASIQFKKPGTSTFFAAFVITNEELKAIKDALAALPSVERVYSVELVDAECVVHAAIDKTVYITRRQ